MLFFTIDGGDLYWNAAKLDQIPEEDVVLHGYGLDGCSDSLTSTQRNCLMAHLRAGTQGVIDLDKDQPAIADNVKDTSLDQGKYHLEVRGAFFDILRDGNQLAHSLGQVSKREIKVLEELVQAANSAVDLSRENLQLKAKLLAQEGVLRAVSAERDELAAAADENDEYEFEDDEEDDDLAQEQLGETGQKAILDDAEDKYLDGLAKRAARSAEYSDDFRTACSELRRLAEEVGITAYEIQTAKNWTAVAEMIRFRRKNSTGYSVKCEKDIEVYRGESGHTEMVTKSGEVIRWEDRPTLAPEKGKNEIVAAIER